MQNRYTGDIGDFGKFGLLRALAASCLTIGVNWYLTPDSFYTEQHNQLIESAGFGKSSGLALKFRTTLQRYYFFILHARHKEAIEGAVNNMLSTAWSDHFCTL